MTHFAFLNFLALLSFTKKVLAQQSAAAFGNANAAQTAQRELKLTRPERCATCNPLKQKLTAAETLVGTKQGEVNTATAELQGLVDEYNAQTKVLSDKAEALRQAIKDFFATESKTPERAAEKAKVKTARDAHRLEKMKLKAIIIRYKAKKAEIQRLERELKLLQKVAFQWGQKVTQCQNRKCGKLYFSKWCICCICCKNAIMICISSFSPSASSWSYYEGFLSFVQD